MGCQRPPAALNADQQPHPVATKSTHHISYPAACNRLLCLIKAVKCVRGVPLNLHVIIQPARRQRLGPQTLGLGNS